MIPRQDFLDRESPRGVEVYQLTQGELPCSHVYMEAQIFTPDASRLIIHQAATAHGGRRDNPAHQYLLCDLTAGGQLIPLTEEPGAWAPSVSPDGQWMYYFVDTTEPGQGRIELKRVKLDGSWRESILVLDSLIPGTRRKASRLYPLSTISSDGQRLAISAFLGDGRRPSPPFGLLVFDLTKATVNLVLEGPSWCNMHSQYCRSLDPREAHDILIQENHGCVVSHEGKVEQLVGEPGADIHVIRDDGSNFRTMPWGRDGIEHCQGHQCWRGRSTWAITSTTTYWPKEFGREKENQLIEGKARPDVGHLGLKTPGACRNELSRLISQPGFWHFATDISGQYFISDIYQAGKPPAIAIAKLGTPGVDPLLDYTYVCSTKTSYIKESHPHPFLSPDGKLGFFNSDETGLLQAYLIRLPW
ncbi:MAG: hypothetical protein NC911_00025 [Candidatus Omnitrophica bacterium]|nr:hypothetical protein [Candidatus Omnitrophota bacterium]